MRIKRSYVVLIILTGLWLASLAHVVIITREPSPPVFPPQPVGWIDLTFLMGLTLLASLYSVWLGLSYLRDFRKTDSTSIGSEEKSTEAQAPINNRFQFARKKRLILLVLTVFFLVFLPTTYAYIFQQSTQSITQTIINIASDFCYYVNTLSNVDLSPDKGTHSNFNAQQHGPDSIYDTLTEGNTGGASKYEYYSTDDDNGGGGAWASYKLCQTFSSSTSFIITSVKLMLYRSGSTTTATVGIYSTTGNPAYPTGNALTSASGITLTGTASWYEITLPTYTLNAGTTYAIVISGSGGNSGNAVYWRCDTTLPAYANGMYGRSLSSGVWGTARMDNTRDNMFEVWGTSFNYQIDLEEQWNNVNYQEANEFLCVYLGSHVGSEPIKVDVWQNSEWQNLLPNLSVGWNNVTVASYLDSPSFTIRFKGNTEIADTTQDVWTIDATLLHVGS